MNQKKVNYFLITHIFLNILIIFFIGCNIYNTGSFYKEHFKIESSNNNGFLDSFEEANYVFKCFQFIFGIVINFLIVFCIINVKGYLYLDEEVYILKQRLKKNDI